MIRGDVSVRRLAEFTCAGGDLYPVRGGRAVEPEEGIRRQQEAQQQRAEQYKDYQAEVMVAASFLCGGAERTVKGRMDGLIAATGNVVIEEYKCVGELPDQADPVDRGQAWLYAGLYVRSAEADLPPDVQFEIRLIYVQVDTRQERMFVEQVSTAAVSSALAFMVLCYTTRIERHLLRNAQREAWARGLEFPLPEYRPSQQAIARRVYQALKQTDNLLLEAPTGSGKTLAVLYPALKAQMPDDQLFFLTSRNAGARAALAAAGQCDPRREQLCVVEITAKEKTCFVEGMPCDAAACPYAAGYYDRVGDAVSEVLQHKMADRLEVENTARAHQVCPFELSLDAALWADLIVGDYNYVLDPLVRLQRFMGHERLHLLIDEAHQISPRVRSMLTVHIERESVRLAKTTALSALKKRVASIDRALLAIRRVHGQGEHVLASVESLTRACTRFLDAVADTEVELDAHPELKDLLFATLKWRRSDGWYLPDQFAHHVTVRGRDIKVTRACLDPAPYLKDLFAEHGGVVRFSGTVTPLNLYQRLHGQAETASSERAQSPFSSAQVQVLVVRDIATYYRQRDASLARLVDLVQALTAAKTGRYLVALPSYSYLQTLAQACAGTCGQALFQQTQGQSNEETQALLDAFSASESAVLFIVMGGIYGESVDFTEARLSGVIMVGLGLPPPSLERNLMQAYYDSEAGEGWGRMVAYTQPALVKNIQAAGRLIRSPEDFGVICLVDPRFTSQEVQRFFPSHWHPQITSAADVRQKVTQFWEDKARLQENNST